MKYKFLTQIFNKALKLNICLDIDLCIQKVPLLFKPIWVKFYVLWNKRVSSLDIPSLVLPLIFSSKRSQNKITHLMMLLSSTLPWLYTVLK